MEIHARPRGFSLVEVLTVLAIIGVLAGMVAVGISRLKGAAARKSMAADLYSQFLLARSRALARERTQIIVIDAVAGTNGTFGYYQFEDAATPPAIFTPTQLNNLLTAMTDPPTVPAGYTLKLIEQRTSTTNGFLMATDAWPGALPVPWNGVGPLAVSTVGGCSFCAGGTGAIGFLPGGRVAFSDGNAVGGFIVLAGDPGGIGTNVHTGIGIAPTGFVQKVEQR